MAEGLTFFLDRCLGKALAVVLREAGAAVEIHDDHFAQDAADEVWIPETTKRGWVIITKDKNIRRRLGEREAVLTSSARILTLTSGSMGATEMGRIIVNNLRAIEEFVAKNVSPFIAALHRNGTVELLFPKSKAGLS